MSKRILICGDRHWTAAKTINAFIETLAPDAPATNRKNLRRTVEVGVWRIPLDVQRRAMGIEWMTREELSEAIPPAYTEHIGRQLLASLKQLEAA